MTLPLTRLTGLLMLTMTSLATAGPADARNSTPEAPNTGTPNAITPPGGVARGVIRPHRPVDSNMVKRPPTNRQHKMPVIQPPGTAR